MIHLTQTETLIEGINELFTAGCYDTTLPEPHLQLGMRVAYDELSESDKVIYDNFLALFTDKPLIAVDNSPCEIYIDRMVSSPIVEEGLYEMDYNSLDQVDKDKVLAFNQMILLLGNPEPEPVEPVNGQPYTP